MKLRDLITVRSGLVVTRKATKEVTGFDYQQLTLKSFCPQFNLNCNELTEFKSSEPLDDRYLTQVGDVIMRLTTPYTAILIDASTAGLVITSNFAILRQTTQAVDPQYLWWFMNRADTKRTLEQHTASTMMGSIRPQVVGELIVHLVPLHKQQRLGAFYMLSMQEQILLEKLQQEKLKYNQWVMETAQRNVRKDMKL